MDMRLTVDQRDALHRHLARLTRYYEADLLALGRLECHFTGDALAAVREMAEDRQASLDSANALWGDLMEQEGGL